MKDVPYTQPSANGEPHPELISSVDASMPDEEMLYDLAELY